MARGRDRSAPTRVAKRVTFTEITKDAVHEAFREPRAIDFDLVDAQQARRILDRLVGYELSPLLRKRRQAGPVGRPRAVRGPPADRRPRARDPGVRPDGVLERRRPAHARRRPEQPFLARLIQVGDDKLAASPDKKGCAPRAPRPTPPARRAPAARPTASRRCEQKELKRTPAPPFTTSTLQQEAARKLGFSARKTMQLAQRLYEGVDLPGEGTVGLITYMRTDSVNIAEHGAARDRRAGAEPVRPAVRARRAAPLQEEAARGAGGARGHPPDVACSARPTR